MKRVWVAMPGPGNLWCGGIIEKPAAKAAAKATAWQSFVQSAPTGEQHQRLSTGGLVMLKQID